MPRLTRSLASTPRKGGGLGSALRDMRAEYEANSLNDGSVGDDPIELFGSWFDAAAAARVAEPNAMSLTTVDPSSMQPSNRVVLLKSYSETGFQFFSNYTSRKARELDANDKAALTFLWLPLERQIRIEGRVSKLSKAESEAYFRTRPRASQIGAWVSRQSSVIFSSDELKQRERELTASFHGSDVPMPEFWGGYALHPEMIEFWQGRKSRLHDRICFRRARGQHNWTSQRLCP